MLNLWSLCYCLLVVGHPRFAWFAVKNVISAPIRGSRIADSELTLRKKVNSDLTSCLLFIILQLQKMSPELTFPASFNYGKVAVGLWFLFSVVVFDSKFFVEREVVIRRICLCYKEVWAETEFLQIIDSDFLYIGIYLWKAGDVEYFDWKCTH